MLIVLFLVSHFNFLFVPCGGLSWLPVSFLLHVKYTLSYRIVCKKQSKVRCVMCVGMCLYAQLVQMKNKQCKSVIRPIIFYNIVVCTNLTSASDPG